MKITTVLIFVCLLIGCDGEGQDPPPLNDVGLTDMSDMASRDMPSDVDMGEPRDPLERTPTQSGVEPTGHPEVDSPVDSGTARAGVLDSDAGFHGIWAHCKPGDFKLFNSRVEFCVQGVETNRYEFFRGGLLVDGRKVGDTSEDEFDVLNFRKDLETFAAESVYVVRDGSDGGEAVIRADGVDLPIAHFVGALGEALFRRVRTINWSVEYRLKPDVDYVEVVTWMSRVDGQEIVNPNIGDLVGFGDRFSIWAPGVGFNSENATDFDMLIGVNRHRAVGWFVPDPVTQIAVGIGDLPWVLVRDADRMVPAGEEVAAIRWVAIGESVNDINRIRNEVMDTTPQQTQEVTVRAESGGFVADQLIEVLDTAGEAVALTATNENGLAEFSAPDAIYTFRIESPIGGEPLEVTGRPPVDLTVPTPGELDLAIDAEGSPVVASVEVSDDDNRYRFVFNPNNLVKVPIAPGQYRLIIDKGIEYDTFAATINIVAGQTNKVQVTLNRVMDTADYVAGDFHQHLEPSIDSGVHVEDRVLDNLAQGIEFVTPTDHEVITDLQPYIDALGFEDSISTSPGIEVSPASTHFNLFPMPYRRNERARGSIPLAVLEDGLPRQRTVPQMIDLAADHPANPVVQINHGRGSTGFFDTVEFDPSTNPLTNTHGSYSSNYDAMEVINDWPDACSLFEDWSAHLNVGAMRTATGNSDSHGVFGRSGYPRTYLHIPGTEAGDITGDQVRTAMLSRQISVAGNVFVDFTDDMLPGDMVDATANVAKTFNVRVQTPVFAQAQKLLVVVNGDIVEEIDLSAPTEQIVDFDGQIDVTTAVDAWVTFVALGPDISGEIHTGRHVMGFPNAVILDVDGDNQFTPPGPKAMDFAALNTFGFCN